MSTSWSLNHDHKIPPHPLQVGHKVLRALAHCGPRCLAKQQGFSFLLHPKLCLQDLIQCLGTEARFSFNPSQANGKADCSRREEAVVLLLVDKITLLYGHNGGVFPRELDATHASEGLRFKSGAEAQVPVCVCVCSVAPVVSDSLQSYGP